ncbi:MAG: hypothetical protein IT249_03185 [Chitinophagaceae bacterium]|nr:hypothetical protein [Chitinophagaceae bacterium]
MYPILLALHSLLRWFVVIILLYALYRAYSGWLSKKTFTAADNKTRKVSITIVHLEIITGLWLYFISPLISNFLGNFKESVHVKDIRFFGMEHSIMMLVAAVIITIGSAKAKRKNTDIEKFKTWAIWFTIGLLIILISIPWPFSPMAARPGFRSF